MIRRAETYPLLFMKTGIAYAAPPDFFQTLGKVFEASVFSTNQVRREIIRDSKMRPGQQHYLVNKETERRVVDTINTGANVIYNGFLNTRQRREHLQRRIATQTRGAVPILLCIEAPMAIIEQRALERYEDMRQLHPDRRIETPSEMMETAQIMLARIEWPNQVATGEQSLRLDGSRDTENLIALVQDYIATTGMAATVEGPRPTTFRRQASSVR